MTTKKKGQLVPLRNVPIHITVEDVAVSGEILTVYPNDMSVIITQPVSGLGTMLHVPAFAMARVNWLATLDGQNTVAVTERGWERAAQLLLCLYDHSRGKPDGWGVYAVTPSGWTRIEEGL
jgi:hypothetical protein